MLLKRLSEARGVSGKEKEVREIIMAELEGHVDRMEVDTLGNLLVEKRGKKESPRIMLSAHMDEVGMMVAAIEKSGLLRPQKVGGIDDAVLVSKVVSVGNNSVSGVIGAKAIHLQKAGERDKVIPEEQLYIDIGAESKEEAEKLVNIGDYISFDTKAQLIGDGCFSGKALDDRVGCHSLVEILMQEDLPMTLTAAFTVQEEIGLRGSGVAAYTLNPDIALVVETTTAVDVLDSKEYRQFTTLGKGPAFTFMDQSFMGSKKILDVLINAAERIKAPYQFRRFTGAGTDAGRINTTGKGIPTGVISVPCRYLHSPVSIVDLTDIDNTVIVINEFIKIAAEGGLS